MMAHRKEHGLPGGAQAVNVVEGPKATQQVFVALFGRSKAPRPVR